MQYESRAQKTTIVRFLTVGNFKRNRDIRNIRRKLLTVLSILLILIIIDLLKQIASFGSHDNVSYRNTVINMTDGSPIKITSDIIWMIYFIIYIIITIKYIRLAILIFAWLTLILTISYFIKSIFEISQVISRVTATKDNNIIIAVISILILALVIASILLILIIVFSFKLAQLIKTPEIRQIV